MEGVHACDYQLGCMFAFPLQYILYITDIILASSCCTAAPAVHSLCTLSIDRSGIRFNLLCKFKSALENDTHLNPGLDRPALKSSIQSCLFWDLKRRNSAHTQPPASAAPGFTPQSLRLLLELRTFLLLSEKKAGVCSLSPSVTPL